MHAASKIFVKTYLKAFTDTFFLNIRYFYPTKGESLNLQACRETPQFPRLVGHLDLPMRKTLMVVGLLTVMIQFQIKKITACKINDENEKTVFYFLMVFNLLKIIHSFESKKHLKNSRNLIATHKNIWYVTNGFKYKFFSVITQLSVTVTLSYFC